MNSKNFKVILSLLAFLFTASCEKSADEEKSESNETSGIKTSNQNNKLKKQYALVGSLKTHLLTDLKNSPEFTGQNSQDLVKSIAETAKNDSELSAKSTNAEVTEIFVEAAYTETEKKLKLEELSLLEITRDQELALGSILGNAASKAAEGIGDEEIFAAGLVEVLRSIDTLTVAEITTIGKGIATGLNSRTISDANSDGLQTQAAMLLTELSHPALLADLGFSTDNITTIVSANASEFVQTLALGNLDVSQAVEEAAEIFGTADFALAQEDFFDGVIEASEEEASIGVGAVVDALIRGSVAADSSSADSIVSELAEVLYDKGVSDYSDILEDVLDTLATEDPDGASIYSSAKNSAVHTPDGGESIVVETTPYEVSGEYEITGVDANDTVYVKTDSVTVTISNVSDAEEMYLAIGKDACEASSKLVGYSDTATLLFTDDDMNSESELFIKFQNADLVNSECESVGSVVHDNVPPSAFADVSVPAKPVNASTAPIITWTSPTDSGSGMDYIEASIVQDSSSNVVSAVADIGLVETYQVLSGMNFAVGSDHHYTLQAFDKAGNSNTLVESSTFASASWVTATGDDDDAAFGAALDYTDNGDGTVTDNNTGLLWQQIGNGVTDPTQAEANTYCEDLDFAGVTTWRLPTLVELITIQKRKSTNEWPMDLTYFPQDDHAHSTSEWYWTSDVYRPSADPATDRFFRYLFYYGYGWAENKTTSTGMNAKCVSGTFPTLSYTEGDVDGDEYIVENSSGLMFQAAQTTNSVLRTELDELCDNATATTDAGSHAGFTDWRVPTIKEWLVLIDLTNNNSLASEFSFATTQLWGSTLPHNYDGRTYMDATSNSTAIEQNNSGSHPTICVRNK